MLVKTSDLTGPALDYAVAIADGRNYWRTDVTPTRWTQDAFTPSTDWAQGGPIIEREGISSIRKTVEPTRWVSEYSNGCEHLDQARNHGPTALIAAMRCYVASKLGGTVEVADELICA